MVEEAWKLTLAEGLEMISRGVQSAEEWVHGLLARIAECEADVRAWAAVDGDGALAAARQVDRGEAAGPLAGAAVGVKDIIDVAGLPCEGGSPLFAGRVPETDAPVVSRLRAAGALVLGKTVTCELATNAPSVTRNPWNPAHTPGASSSGSAAAVAAGMVPAALATQTGGSILRPAAYCGVAGFKPTYGRLSRKGVIALSWSFDHVGMIARSVADLSLLFAAMAGGGGTGEAPTDGPDGDLVPASAPRSPRRVCFPKDDFLPLASQEVGDFIGSAVSRLRHAGVEVVEGRLPEGLDAVHGANRVVIRCEAAAYHEAAFRENPDAFGPDIRNNVLTGMMVPAVRYLDALRLKSRFTRKMDALFQDFDLMITPSTMDTAPLAEVSTGDPLFSEPFSGSGNPAITLPVGRGGGNLPIGIQLAGARMGEAGLLAAAKWCESELGWKAEIAASAKTKFARGETR